MYRTPQQVRLFNVVKGVVLATCLLTAVWLIYTTPAPVAPQAPPTAVANNNPVDDDDNTPEAPPTATASATATATTVLTPASEEDAIETLPTLAPTAVPVEPTTTISPMPSASATATATVAQPTTVAIPAVTATMTLPVTATPSITATPTITTVATAPITGEAEAPPAIIPPSLPADNAPLIYYPADGQTREATDIDLLGIALPNSTLELWLNGEPLALIPVQSVDGRWFYTYPTGPGDYRFEVRYVGETDSPTAVEVTLLAPPAGETCTDPTPGQDLGQSYIVGDCEWLLGIARKLGIDYVTLVNLNPEIQDPNFLISGQRLRLPPRP